MKEKLDKLCDDCVEFTNMDSKNCCLVIAGTGGEMGVTAMLGNKKNLFEHLVNAIMDDYENRDGVTLKFLSDVVGCCFEIINEKTENEPEKENTIIKLPIPKNKYKS